MFINFHYLKKVSEILIIEFNGYIMMYSYICINVEIAMGLISPKDYSLFFDVIVVLFRYKSYYLNGIQIPF